MTTTQGFDHLALASRAYQVLYALGDEASTVRTLEPTEAACLVGIVHDVRAGQCKTTLDALLKIKMSRGMLEYVAEGGL